MKFKNILITLIFIFPISSQASMYFSCAKGQEIKVKKDTPVFKAKIHFQVTEYGVYLNFTGEPAYTFPPFSSDGVSLATQDQSGTTIGMKANGMDTTFIVFNAKEQVQYIYTQCGNGILK